MFTMLDMMVQHDSWYRNNLSVGAFMTAYSREQIEYQSRRNTFSLCEVYIHHHEENKHPYILFHCHY